MFTLVDNPEFTHTVSVMTPVDNGFKEQTFKARFKLLPTDKIEEYPLTSGFSAQNRTFLREVIVGFEDLLGEDEKPLPYNDELRDKVLLNAPAQMGLMRAYLEAISKAKAGN